MVLRYRLVCNGLYSDIKWTQVCDVYMEISLWYHIQDRFYQFIISYISLRIVCDDPLLGKMNGPPLHCSNQNFSLKPKPAAPYIIYCFYACSTDTYRYNTGHFAVDNNHKTSLTPPLLIEVHVPSKESTL
jgi:hypothetical protein